MIFGTTQRDTVHNVLFAAVVSIGVVLIFLLAGCGPVQQTQIVPACYEVRPTDSGVFIFEYDAGNQGQISGDSLILFTEALNKWTRNHPELSVIRLEKFSTTVNFKNTQDRNSSINVVNVLVYTVPSGKPPPEVSVPKDGEKEKDKAK